MKPSLSARTITEPARETKICYDADVVVVGGGPAGFGTAVAAARSGAKTVLVERYGHLGGMATGGIVLMLRQVFANTGDYGLAGLCQEMFDKSDVLGGVLHPDKRDVGSTDEKLLNYWRSRTGAYMIGDRVPFTSYFDPEILKCVINEIVTEAGVKLFLHSWATQAIVDKGTVKGIIFESKSGRQAILGKVIIDTTGDGDIFASAGTECDDAMIDPDIRCSQLALVFRVGNVDFKRFNEFRQKEPEKNRELIRQMESIWSEEHKAALLPGGGSLYRMVPLPTPREDVVWVNNFIRGLSATNVEDLTWVEVNIRKGMLLWHDFFKKHFPGFEKSFIMDTASQIGTRGGRRLVGEYIVNMEDIRSGKIHEDTIAVFRRIMTPEVDRPPWVYIPYRSLVPRRIEGLLAAGRCYSSDPAANNMTNVIPQCVVMGQAAGTAAALAVKGGVTPRQVEYRALRENLVNQGIPLPDAVERRTTT